MYSVNVEAMMSFEKQCTKPCVCSIQLFAFLGLACVSNQTTTAVPQRLQRVFSVPCDLIATLFSHSTNFEQERPNNWTTNVIQHTKKKQKNNGERQ